MTGRGLGITLLLAAGSLRCVADPPASRPAAVSPASGPASADWPMWGGQPSRNAVSPARNLPAEWDVESKEGVLWSAPLGTTTYGGPVVAGGRVFVGTNNGGKLRPEIAGDRGCLLCLDQRTGVLLWQATHDKLASGPANDWPEQGVASTPCVDGDRVYYVSNRAELVCADISGLADGKNDGPYRQEQYTGSQDADFIWILDLIGQLGVYPHNLAACSPVVAGDLVFICTGNGVDDDHEKPPAPDAPSFVAVDKRTGHVVWKRNDPGKAILHGQWSSPAYGVIGGQPQVIFGGGDGWCYSFGPADGQPLWKFDLNPKDSVWEIGGTGTRTSIVATPVICQDRVYVASGDDPENSKGPGHLYAIDATRRGDITETGRLWQLGGSDFGRTISSPAIAEGLLYAADLDGYLSCCDVQTGKRLWRCDLKAGVWGSPLLAGGKVYIGTTDGEMVVLKQGPEPGELARNDLGASIFTSAAAADDTLFIATTRRLYAIGKRGAASQPATPPASRAGSQPAASVGNVSPLPSPDPSLKGRGAEDAGWTIFRGDLRNTGVAREPLPDRLAVRWRFEAGDGTSSTAAIAASTVYVGTDRGRMLAIDLETGKLKWQYSGEDAIESSPAVVQLPPASQPCPSQPTTTEATASRPTGSLVIFGDEAGVLRALDAGSGRECWRFEAKDRIVSSPMPVGDRVLFGSYDGHVYCLSLAGGQLVWKYEVGERVHATVTVADSYALFPACDAQLHVVQAADGTSVRTVELGSVSGAAAAVSGDRAFVGCYGDQVIAVDWRSGTVAWRYQDPEHSFPFLSSAAVADGMAIIGCRDKRVRALDVATGKLRWEFLTRGRVDSSPVVVGARVFVGSADGNLYELDLASGEERWRFEAGGAMSASPAVGEGCLVIGTEDGMIYCLAGALTTGK